MSDTLSKYYLVPANVFDRLKSNEKTKTMNNRKPKPIKPEINLLDPNSYTKNALLSRELRNRLMRKRMFKLMSENNNNNLVVNTNARYSPDELEFELEQMNATNKPRSYSTNPFLTADDDELRDYELSRELSRDFSDFGRENDSFGSLSGLIDETNHSTPQSKSKIKPVLNLQTKTRKNLSTLLEGLNESEKSNKKLNLSKMYEDVAVKPNPATLALLNDDIKMQNPPNLPLQENAEEFYEPEKDEEENKFVFWDATMPSMIEEASKRKKIPKKLIKRETTKKKRRVKDKIMMQPHTNASLTPIFRRTRSNTAKRLQEQYKSGLTPTEKRKRLSSSIVWKALK